MSEPLISIITICYNSAATIGRTLESVAAQRDVPVGLVEHWVVDGASKDSTIEVVKKYPHARWVSERDRGIADAFNKGLRLARGQWILFLNSDDRFADPDVLKEVIPKLEAGKDIVYGRLILVDQATDREVLTVGSESSWRYLDRRMSVPHPCSFTHRRYFEKHGEFDLSFKIAMDYELFLRGYGQTSFGFVPRVITRMATGGVSHANQGYRDAIECFRAKSRNGVQNPIVRSLWVPYQTLRPKVGNLVRRIWAK